MPSKESAADPDFIDFFFDFATTYTEEMIFDFMAKARREKEQEEGVSGDLLRSLGYTEEDLLLMGKR